MFARPGTVSPPRTNIRLRSLDCRVQFQEEKPLIRSYANTAKIIVSKDKSTSKNDCAGGGNCGQGELVF